MLDTINEVHLFVAVHAGIPPASQPGILNLTVDIGQDAEACRQQWRGYLPQIRGAILAARPSAVLVSAGFDADKHEAHVEPAGSGFLLSDDFFEVGHMTSCPSHQ